MNDRILDCGFRHSSCPYTKDLNEVAVHVQSLNLYHNRKLSREFTVWNMSSGLNSVVGNGGYCMDDSRFWHTVWFLKRGNTGFCCRNWRKHILYMKLERFILCIFLQKYVWVLRNVLYVAEILSVVFEKAAAADAEEQLILSDHWCNLSYIITLNQLNTN